MTREEIDNTKYKVCCPVCENKICVKGTVSCEAEHWAKSQQAAIDLEELRHRFGNEVAFVVEDMIKGTSERWSCSEKPNMCDDAISRQAAIDAIENEQKKIMHSDWAIDQAKFSAMSDIRALIADLPSVSTEKTGRWIDSSNGWMCSECNKDNTFDTNYCPSCGAKMGVEE